VPKITAARRNLLIWLLVLAGILAAMAYFLDWRLVLVQLARANWWKLGLSSLVLLVGYILFALRWRLFLHSRPGFQPIFHTSNIGNMANTLLPMRPGDLMRVFLLHGAAGTPFMQVTSSLVIERWYEQIMRLAALGGAVAFGAGLVVSRQAVWGTVIFLGLVFGLMVWMVRRQELVLAKFPPWLARLPRLSEEQARNGLVHLLEGFANLSSPARMLEGLLSSLLTWAFFWGFHYLCLLSLQPGLPQQTLLALSLGSLALAPPSATTLPGMYQVSVVLPLAVLGYERNLLTSYSVLLNLTEMLLVNLLGVWGAASLDVSLDRLFNRAQVASQTHPEGEADWEATTVEAMEAPEGKKA